MKNPNEIPAGDLVPEQWELRPLGKGEFEFVEPVWPSEVDDLLDEAFDAAEEDSLEEAAEILEQVLEVAPDNLEAWISLADVNFDMGDSAKRLEATTKAFEIVMKALPPKFHAADYKLPGELEGNAILLRVFYSHGCALADAKRPEEARRILEDVLKMDIEDEQGARYVLPAIYLELKEPTQIMVLRDKFPDDHAADIIWNIPLAFFYLDESDMARVAMKDAFAKSPLVAKELMRSKHEMPQGIPIEGIEIGSEFEAYAYFLDMYDYWKEAKGALAMLKEIAG